MADTGGEERLVEQRKGGLTKLVIQSPDCSLSTA